MLNEYKESRRQSSKCIFIDVLHIYVSYHANNDCLENLSSSFSSAIFQLIKSRIRSKEANSSLYMPHELEKLFIFDRPQ